MLNFVRTIFFGNYFIGFIAVALSVESCVQLRLPLNSLQYYGLLFCVAVFYYTYAYSGPLYTPGNNNPRTAWYYKNKRFVAISQRALIIVAFGLMLALVYINFHRIIALPPVYWLAVCLIALAGLLYYGLLPASPFALNLRNTGWLKAFVIGFVWACCANILSFIAVQIEFGLHPVDTVLLLWLFVKNWMFCTVNAIIFDIKDYADDSNRQLKTFVVRYGLKKTIWLVLFPLISAGLLALLAFSGARNFERMSIAMNLIPFVLLIMIVWSMQKPHTLLYYLVVIDGLIFLKAICGIIGMQFNT